MGSMTLADIGMPSLTPHEREPVPAASPTLAAPLATAPPGSSVRPVSVPIVGPLLILPTMAPAR
ncbi:hypothetical protein GCM10009632_11700 [Mycolicibacterium alvei]|uniref:Uncharacterized protein n=1 Tax=Mycolicibacterium alvei TaxID=67081 RepID=A0A6N4USV1_9MYCO|nr:hypothetical protein MALV_30850 [Mycolicibacterium alvei]